MKNMLGGVFIIDYYVDSMHMFGGHQAQIRDVGWRPEQDYIIVQCEDGSVSVWEVLRHHASQEGRQSSESK